MHLDWKRKYNIFFVIVSKSLPERKNNVSLLKVPYALDVVGIGAVMGTGPLRGKWPDGASCAS